MKDFSSDLAASAGAGSIENVNIDLLEFLRLERADLELAKRFYDRLTADAKEFSKSFYSYLNLFSQTSIVLSKFEQSGGNIERLVESQVTHLFNLLRARTDAAYTNNVVQLGRMHYRIGVTPVWLTGAYQLYHLHLNGVIDGLDADVAECSSIRRVVSGLVARDLGLMMEGYRRASVELMRDQRDDLSQFVSQVNSLLSNVPPVVWSVDPKTEDVIFEGPGLSRLFGEPTSFPIPGIGRVQEDHARNLEHAWFGALGGESAEHVCMLDVGKKSARWISYGFHPVVDDLGAVVRVDCVAKDITEQRRIEAQVASLSTIDELTGLPNRTLLTDRTEQAIASARRDGTHGVALLIFDLNGFKEINRAFGQAVGDAALCTVGERLARTLRESDTLARFGGDEFAVLLPRVDDSRAAARQVAENMVKTLALPVRVGEHELNLTGSVGMSVYPGDADSADEMSNHAIIAMQDARGAGTPDGFYDPKFAAKAREYLNLATELRHAATRNQLEVFYQPIVNLETGRTTSVEALIRWHHSSLGLIRPDQFLPLAERSGSMKSLSEWVMHEALSQIQKWSEQFGEMRVAVNMSARDFQDDRVVSLVEQLLRDTGVSHDRLTLEITEHMVMVNPDRAADVIGMITESGISVALDDFGTGYSSLSHLRQFPFTTLKIDKSFLKHAGSDSGAEAIIESIVQLANRLGYDTVAEGVETKEQFAVAERLGCHAVQGYWIKRPEPAAEIGKWLSEGLGGCLSPLQGSRRV